MIPAARSHDSKRILLILHEAPLPFGGAAARWYYVLLNGLVQAGHRVTVICPARNEAESDETRKLFPTPRFDLKCFAIPNARRGILDRLRSYRRPFSYLMTPALHAEVQRQLATGIDIVHLEQHWTGWIDLPDAIRRERTVINAHYLFQLDRANAPREARFRDRLLNRRTIAAERELVKRFPNWVTLTPPLSDAVKTINSAARVWTIPMAIDLSLYEFQRPTAGATTPPVLGLIGSFNWTPGASAAVRLIERIWPLVRGRLPEAKLLIVGRAARAALGRFEPTTPGLELHEDVPDVIPFFRRLDVLLYAPPAGSGMKVKILEAFALGTPAVTNANGVEGLAIENDVQAKVREDDDALADAAVDLLANPSIAARQAIAARQLLETGLPANRIIAQWNAVYEQVITGARGST